MDEQLIGDGEAKAFVEFFLDKPVTNELLLEYANSHGFTPIGVERYEDYKYSYEFDRRMEGMLPDVVAVLGQIRWVPECASDKERVKVADANAALTQELCFLLEKHGILYQEISDVTSKLGTLIKGMFDSAATRVNNMCAVQLYTVAEEKFGKPLTVKAMGEHQRKGAPFHKEAV